MRLKALFQRKPDKFRELLIQQASKALEGTQRLEQFVHNPTPQAAAAVEQSEKDADELRRILIDELNRTFVTPFDREDIFGLSRAIDDVLDYAHTSADQMSLFGIRPSAEVVGIVGLLCQAANELYLATLRLADHPAVALEHAKRAKAIENRVEQLYRTALKGLFENVTTVEDVTRVLKTREILRHLSNCADRGDAAANLISDIVVKGS